MDDGFGSTFITVSDEEGNDYELEHLDTIEYEGETYMAFGISDEGGNEEEVEVVIMHVVEQDGEEMLEELEDEEMLDTVYGLFMERVDQMDEDEEDDE